MNIKVLMFGWEFPPHNSGGLGTACHGLTRALVGNDVDVTFVLPRTDVKSDWMNILSANIKTIKIKGVNSMLSAYMTPDEYSRRIIFNRGGPYAEDLIGEVKRYAVQAGEIAGEQKHNIIHAHEWLSFLAGVEAKKVSGKPVVMHVHSTEFDRSGGSVNREVYEIEGECLRNSDKIISVSDYTRNILIKKYGIRRNVVEVVHNGVHQPGEPQFKSTKKNEILKLKSLGYKIVLYVGRFSLHKGPDYFIRAAKKVLKYHPKTVFVMAGSGEMEHELIKLVAKEKLSQNVLFAGFLRGSDLAQMYSSADLYILPSVSEPFGIAPLESLTYGTPVMVSKQSGVAEALKHALKVDFWDVEEMTNKIVSVLKYKTLRENLSQNGLDEVEKFNWDSAAKKCIGVYSSLI